MRKGVKEKVLYQKLLRKLWVVTFWCFYKQQGEQNVERVDVERELVWVILHPAVFYTAITFCFVAHLRMEEAVHCAGTTATVLLNQSIDGQWGYFVGIAGLPGMK